MEKVSKTNIQYELHPHLLLWSQNNNAMHINEEKKHSKNVFHFENVLSHPFITFIQDKSCDFFLKASHPQNNFCPLLSLGFIETVFVLLWFNYDLYISQNTFVHTISHNHTGFMLFCYEKHETVFEHSNVFCRTQDLHISVPFN